MIKYSFMKKSVTIITTIILSIVNFLVLRYLVSDVSQLSVYLSTASIAVNGILCLLAKLSSMSDGFKVSLPFLFSFTAFVEYIISFLAQEEVHNNWAVISVIVLVTIELLIFFICWISTSKK